MDALLVALGASFSHVNLAVHSLAAACRASGFSVQALELNVNMPSDAVFSALCAARARAVGFSLYVWNREQTLKAASDLKKVRPDTVIFLGGPEASFHDAELLEACPFVDAVFVGEGEEALPAWLLDVNAPHPGVSRRDGGRVLRGTCQTVSNLDTLPNAYASQPAESMVGRLLYFETSRGCPFSCSYCLSSVTPGVRCKSLPKVKQELTALLESGNVRCVKLVDRTFNTPPGRAEEILSFLAADTSSATFHLEVAGDLLTERQVALLTQMRAGKVQIEVGVQSTNARTLEAIGRRCSWDDLRENVGRIVSAGRVHVHADLIAGLPYEDYASLSQSFNDVYSLRPHHVQLGFLKLLPGTRLRRQAEDFGMLYRDYPPYEVLTTRWMSAGELTQVKAIAGTVERFYNSGRFSESLSHLLEHVEPFAFYEDLAAFLERETAVWRPLKTDTLYALLWAYGGKAEALRQTLALDWHVSGQTGALPEGLHPDNPPDMASLCRETLSTQDFWDRYFPGTPTGQQKSMAKRLRFAMLNLGQGPELFCFDSSHTDPVTGHKRFFRCGQP